VISKLCACLSNRRHFIRGALRDAGVLSHIYWTKVLLGGSHEGCESSRANSLADAIISRTTASLEVTREKPKYETKYNK
jgi:hypothetical protein